MVFLDLFPVGIWQFKTVAENGLWFARSEAFIGSAGFKTFTWLRIIGRAMFTLGGVVPLVWMVMRNRKNFIKTAKEDMPDRTTAQQAQKAAFVK
jgi:nitric oxide reductase subunit B